MAALALPTSRLSTRLFAWSSPSWLAAAATLPAFLGAPSSSGWRLPAAIQSLLEWFPPIDLAVPKKKTSHSRKAMRSANKGLKDKRKPLTLE
ncbi:hypothetical protein EIP86_002846 [Pleurotus ostreatoroseus]|nr:hypothetical protein EIP86_002846 [Pleurotus ostreatoroseus]